MIAGCPTCGAFNRVAEGQGASATCGGCGGSLAGSTWRRTRLPRLSPPQYEHGFERKALAGLEKVPALGTAVNLFNKHGLDHLLKVEVTGSNLRVTANNVPEAMTALREVCKVLAMAEEPELYLEPGDQISALTSGVHSPVICLTTGALEALTRDELFFVLGREVGHIRSNHLLYQQMARVLPKFGDVIGEVTLNIGKLISRGLVAALRHWCRMSELTADRAGLLACQDGGAAETAFVKMAGLPRAHYPRMGAAVEGFRRQAVEFESVDEDWGGKIARGIALSDKEHPWTVVRAAQLQSWVQTKDYDMVLSMAAAAAPEQPV